jgi:hypothetical protein
VVECTDLGEIVLALGWRRLHLGGALFGFAHRLIALAEALIDALGCGSFRFFGHHGSPVRLRPGEPPWPAGKSC